MKINLNVLCALVLYMVSGEVDDPDVVTIDVVTIDKCAPAQRTVKLLKQLMQPTGLNHAISNNMVLYLST
jgi:hypothetical protein